MAKEKNLTSITTVAAADFARMVTSAGASVKATAANLAKYIVETYNGSTVAGSAQSVKSALDSLNSKLTIESLSSCASLSDVSTMLTNKLGTMTDNSVAQIRFAVTANFDPFQNGSTYWGELRRSTAPTYSSVILYGLGTNRIIFGYKTASGWFFRSISQAPMQTTVAKPSSPPSDITLGSTWDVYANRDGKFATLQMNFNVTAATNGTNIDVVTLPSDMAPSKAVYKIAMTQTGNPYILNITVGGVLRLYFFTAITTSVFLRETFTYSLV